MERPANKMGRKPRPAATKVVVQDSGMSQMKVILVVRGVVVVVVGREKKLFGL